LSKIESEFRVISKFIAQWALPNEGIPLFLIWKGKFAFDSVEIEMPESFVVRRYYNINKKDLSSSRRIGFDELKKEGYIGIVFTSPMLEQVSEKVQVILRFVKDGEDVYREEFETHIIRPRIELEIPERIELLPNEPVKANIGLRYTGYGNIYFKIIVSGDPNKLVFDVKDFRDLFLVMANSNTFKQFMHRNCIPEEEFLGSKVPEDQFEYRELLLDTSQIGEFTAESFFDTIKRVMDNKKMMEILERSMDRSEDVTMSLFKSIIDFVEKRPVESVFLSETEIKPVQFDEGEKSLYVCIGYVDDFGNYYTQTKKIPIIVKKKNAITFGSRWDERAGNWEWLKEE
jgi:hypothetical protein